MLTGDTIVAQSTPYGYAGIGVVRLSGVECLEILKKISNSDKNFQTRVVQKTKIYRKKTAIDETMVTYFKKPKSFTGEDMVEISCHGNPYIIESIIEECIDNGARTAGPGEFTRRAYTNGKIDLIQAESIANMISAGSETGLYNAISGLSGRMSKDIKETSNEITELLSYCEHLLDVSEIDIQKDNINYIKEKTTSVTKKISKMTENYHTCRVLTYGATIAIAGKTNSGKSTLFNTLIGSNRSIVNKTAGTTRDYIDAKLSLKGVPVRLIDTAGIRKTKNAIEQTGIEKAVEVFKSADLVLLVKDLTDNVETQVVDYIDLTKNNIITVFNKVDVFEQKLKHASNNKGVYLSALKGKGINVLKKEILSRLNLEKVPSKITGVSTPRQYENLTACLKSLNNITRDLIEDLQLELVCYELDASLQCINDLLGVNTSEKVLNNMFDSFCVGK